MVDIKWIFILLNFWPVTSDEMMFRSRIIGLSGDSLIVALLHFACEKSLIMNLKLIIAILNVMLAFLSLTNILKHFFVFGLLSLVNLCSVDLIKNQINSLLVTCSSPSNSQVSCLNLTLRFYLLLVCSVNFNLLNIYWSFNLNSISLEARAT